MQDRCEKLFLSVDNSAGWRFQCMNWIKNCSTPCLDYNFGILTFMNIQADEGVIHVHCNLI